MKTIFVFLVLSILNLSNLCRSQTVNDCKQAIVKSIDDISDPMDNAVAGLKSKPIGVTLSPSATGSSDPPISDSLRISARQALIHFRYVVKVFKKTVSDKVFNNQATAAICKIRDDLDTYFKTLSPVLQQISLGTINSTALQQFADNLPKASSAIEELERTLNNYNGQSSQRPNFGNGLGGLLNAIVSPVLNLASGVLTGVGSAVNTLLSGVFGLLGGQPQQNTNNGNSQTGGNQGGLIGGLLSGIFGNGPVQGQ